MDYVRKEKLRIARSSNTPEARIQAFYDLAGDDDAYDIFIEALNNRNVSVVGAAIYGLANYPDSRWEILLDLLEDKDFGYGEEIIRNIRDSYIDLETYTSRLRSIIPQRSDALELIQTLSNLSNSNGKIVDMLVRDSIKYHDFWRYGNAYIINYLDLSHPVSLNIVKRMLFREPVEMFNSITYKARKAIQAEKSTRWVISDFKTQLFGFFSTLVVLSNKYKEIDNEFELESHISALDTGSETSKTVNDMKKFLKMYLERSLKTDLTYGSFAYHRNGEEIWLEESTDEYVHLDD